MQSELPLKYVLVNGIRFAYHEAGSGPLVLCLHGFPDTAQSFTHLLPTLAGAGYRAVAIYMRGYAPTPPAPDGDYSPLSLARDVLGIIEALGVRSADVIGHDWGAYAAYCAANITPSRIRRLVLMSVPHIGGSAHSFKQVFRSWYVMYFQLPNLPEKKVAANNFAFIDKLYKRWSPNWEPSSYDLGPVKKALAAPGGLAAALGYYRAIFLKSTQQAWAVLSAKTVTPTLMIAGEADGSVGPEVFVKSKDAFTGPFELRTLPRVGHFPHREAVDEVEEMILQFLERDLRKSEEGEPPQQRERRHRTDRRLQTDRRQQDDRRHMTDRRLTPGREEYEEELDELAAGIADVPPPPVTVDAPALTEEQIEAQRLEQERLEQERIRQEEERRQVENEQEKRRQDEERLERLRLDQIELERRREEELREEQKRQVQLEEERLRQEEEERQEQLRQEQIEQERLRQEDELLQARLREEQVELEKRQQEEALKLAQLRQQQAERERIRKEEEERLARQREEQQERERQRQEEMRQEETRRAQLEQERLRQEQAEQERIRQEQLQQAKFQQEQQRLEQYRLEQLEQERLQQEQLEQERLRQEQIKQEQLKQEQEKLRREREEMERFRQAQLKYEPPRPLSKEEIEKARLEEARKKLAGESDEDSTPFPF